MHLTVVEFFHMGGYAKFVWSAYALCFIILFVSIYLPWRERKKLLKKLLA
jgi:heme exporter protein D